MQSYIRPLVERNTFTRALIVSALFLLINSTAYKWPKSTTGFERAGLTYFAITFSLPLAISRTSLYNTTFLSYSFPEADAR